MAKVSAVQRNAKREKLIKRYAEKRASLKAVVNSKESSVEEKMEAVRKLSELPKNSAKIRARNRCVVTGRPRGYYRKFRMSRIAVRELGSQGMIPGLVKSSW